ncbi:MAG: formylglycine-generating enzyme family protein [Acidobacteria bacterium]|nr:formylglycine-generating enzyme family protein [Acidobacteriota bacterium]MBI3427106.1 formylglycine-generating enzyme family protein [Acidobacteriota bacterium]
MQTTARLILGFSLLASLIWLAPAGAQIPRPTPKPTLRPARPTPKPTPVPTPAPTPSIEKAIWNTIKNSADPAMFDKFLADYPNGEFASAARARRAELLRPKPTPTPTPLPPATPTPTPTPAPAPAAGTIRKNNLGMEFVYLPAGSFMRGSTDADIERIVKANKLIDSQVTADLFKDEKPQHRVTISQPFYLGRFEVTQQQWQAVMETTVQQQRDKANPNYNLSNVGPKQPMYFVSWEEAQEFIQKLNQRNDGFTYRLPTEAEWEYAARAETTGDYAGNLETMAWYGDNSGKAQRDSLKEWVKSGRNAQKYYDDFLKPNGNGTHEVGSKSPNRWGLYDMHGNVWEWCADWYGDYVAGNQIDPKGPDNGTYRVLRGGSWYYYSRVCRSALRFNYSPGDRGLFIGFRVVSGSRTP